MYCKHNWIIFNGSVRLMICLYIDLLFYSIDKYVIEFIVCVQQVKYQVFHLLQPWLSKDGFLIRNLWKSFYLSSCTLWLLYGYSANISTIVIVNFIGASLEMLYALTYLRYTPDRVNLIERIQRHSQKFLSSGQQWTIEKSSGQLFLKNFFQL